MNSAAILLCTALVVALFVQQSEAIDCYVGSCSDCKIHQWKPSYTNKQSGCTACSSRYSKVKVLFVKVEATVWGCETVCNPTSSSISGISKIQHDCCTTTLCNGAAGVTAGVLLLTGAAWLTTLLH